ncbi:hypothetical protein GWI33_003055, partial [Rhynchophorus ferrugineus]
MSNHQFSLNNMPLARKEWGNKAMITNHSTVKDNNAE